MPINRENSIQVGATITNEDYETMTDLCVRFVIPKSQYIRKAIKEMNYKLIEEMKVLS